jgi:flagellar biosynthesis/type III secretory pathway chaperone
VRAPSGGFERLEAVLADEAGELERLAEVLEREREALGAGLGDGIAALAAEKESCAERLARLGESRQALLAAQGVRRGMNELLERAPRTGSLRAAWRRVADRARAARALNGQVGALIGVHQRHIQSRLAALAAASPASTYGPDGAARPRGPKRALGTA